ncbi:MAG: GNAT family N-acetyltransferase [Treponema sp.]|nr:GNAT family N-acetyltransferase [Treponema sp.]
MLIFELLDEDGPGFIQVRNQVFNFLLSHEEKCVSLLSHFKNNDTKIYYIVNDRNTILGVISISSGGQILHCIESPDALAALQEFISVNKIENLFSIIGEKVYTQAIAKIFFGLYGKVSKAENEYLLMNYSQTEAEKEILTFQTSPEQQKFLSSCEISLCKDQDFDDIFPLQKAYEIEEVVIDKKNFNEHNSRILLRKAIQDQGVFILKKNGKILAKASVNAWGENYIQLGGVYTLLEFRNGGIATYLVKNLIQRFKKENKKMVLFVKKTNVTAQNVYKKCGFIWNNDYKILYY